MLRACALVAVAVIGCARPAALAVSEAEVPSGDATLKLWIAGGNDDSDVLVLINGGPGLSHESMEPLQRAFASARLRVVMYDQRGVGRSTARGTAPFTPSEYVDDLDAIRAYLHRDRIHLLGHSFGGMIALSYFDRHPEHVASLVLVSPGVSDPAAMKRGGELLGQRVTELQHQGIIPDPLPADCARRTLAVLPAYFADPKLPIPAELARRSCDASNRSSVLFDFIDTPYQHAMGSTKVRALVVYGDHEPFGPGPSLAAAAALGAAKPDVVELKACGHLGWFECRDEFMRAVEPFVTRSGCARCRAAPSRPPACSRTPSRTRPCSTAAR